MKKTLAVLLACLLLVSALAGCGNKDKDKNVGTNNNPTSNQTGNTEYQYLFRDLPEAKYLTPATEFAGGDGTESNPYQISNAAELALLHEKMVAEDKELKSVYQKAYYVLTADIAVNDTANFANWETAAPEYSWMPIGFGTVTFYGVFDGNGHTISGLYINTNAGTKDETSTDNYGLFDTVNGTVKNLKIDKSYFAVSGKTMGSVGSIAGLLTDEATVDNCSSNAVLNCYDSSCGGIVGQAYGGVDTGIVDEGEEREIKYSTVSNCTFAGKITQVKAGAMTYIGGIIGSSDGNVDACVNNGTLNFAGDNVDSVGGIAGRMSEGTMSNCKNTGALNCEMKGDGSLAIAGGIVGKVFVSATGSAKYMSRGVTITNCENSGTVAAQMYAGGIAGQISNDRNDYCITVSECVNSGVVASEKHTGGIVGYLNCIGDAQKDSIVIENCENKADLTKGTVGGIISKFMTEKGDVKIKGCKNSGNLTSEGQHCAGIIAYWIMDSKPSDSNIVVDACENTGSITSALNAGGIISFMDMPVCLEMGKNISVSIANCVNSGNVTTSKVNGYIGGILGNWGMANVATTIDNCTNSGTLAITAAADSMTEEEAEIMTVSRIAGGIVGRVGSGLLLTTDSDKADNKYVQSANADLKITNSKNTGKLEVVNENAEFYKNWFGGIVGNTCGEDGFAIFVDKCTYTGFDRGLGNENLSDIGTKN